MSGNSQSNGSPPPLRVRWLGTAPYREVWDLQRRLFAGRDDHLLLVEHRPVFTIGRSGDPAHLLIDPEEVDAELVKVDRGGDITFHGPGQIVGYPILTVPGKRGGGMADTVAFVQSLEQVLIDVSADLGLATGRVAGQPGVWVDADGDRPRKLAAVGIRLSRGRSMHGFALNNDVDLGWFGRIVPCGIADKGVTSLAAEGIEIETAVLVDRLVERAAEVLAPGRSVERNDVVFRHREVELAPFSRGLGPGNPIKPTPNSARAQVQARPEPVGAGSGSTGVPVRLKGRLAEAGVAGGLDLGERKPPWMRVKLKTSESFLQLKALTRDLELTTVCEEAGCPNIFDCWNEGTATFMLLGERCTRACGFCLIDTRKPAEPDPDEPRRVADAVERLGLRFAVLTMVARDDLVDGGASQVATTIRAIKERTPDVGVEALISDLKGSATDLATVCDAEPDILNHNVETVARLQRAVRPSAGYARSLTVLARAADRGRTTKSGLIVGLGEAWDEVVATLADLAAVGVDVVTVGQYLRPTSNHLPVQRWWTPEEFEALKLVGEQELGLKHVAATPLTRSSHHAGSIAGSL